MLELIRANKFLNIFVGILSALLAGLYYITRQDILLYGGVGIGLYWALFWWLNLMTHVRRAKDKKYQARVKAEKEMWVEMRKNRLPLRQRLLEMSKTSLVRELLRGKRNFCLFESFFACYLLGLWLAFLYIFNLFSILLSWTTWVGLGVICIYIAVSVSRMVYYILESRGLTRDLLEPENIKRGMKEVMALEAVVRASETLELALAKDDPDYIIVTVDDEEELFSDEFNGRRDVLTSMDDYDPDYISLPTGVPPGWKIPIKIVDGEVFDDPVIEAQNARLIRAAEKAAIETAVDLSEIEHEDDE